MHCGTLISYIPLNTHSPLTTILSDGCFDGIFYYFVDNKTTNVFKYTAEFKLCGTFKTSIALSSITYDSLQNSFWGATSSDSTRLYQFDACFEQMTEVLIKHSALDIPPIRTLSFDYNCHAIVATTAHELLYINQQGHIIHSKKASSPSDQYLATYLTSDTTFIMTKEDKNTYIHLVDEHGQIETFSIPTLQYTYKSIITLCGPQYDVHSSLQLLATSNVNGSYIIQVNLNLKCNNHCSCTDSCTCSPPPSSCCTYHSLCDILTSIALVEASLSHILNAEGEKLQRGIVLATNICDLITLNKSIEKTLSYAIQLETTLTNKLSEALDHLDC
ncbi:MAG: hypothetical protein ACRDDX_07075 [Cellulosilyticaceae bacterium]